MQDKIIRENGGIVNYRLEKPKTKDCYQIEFDADYLVVRQQILPKLCFVAFNLAMVYLLKYLAKSSNGVIGSDGKEVGQNTYTTAHKDVNVFFFLFISKCLILNLVALSIKPLGLVKDMFIKYTLILPFQFIVRVIILGYWLNSLVTKDLIPHLRVVFHLNYTNWWRNKEEPFFTNSSFLNAFFCWFWWCVIWGFAIFLVLVILRLSVESLYLAYKGEFMQIL